MIRRAWFEEFRALRKVSVELAPLTVFVGPNGSGKSSVLEGIHYPLRVAWQPIQQALQGPWRPDRLRNTRATEPMRLGVSFAGAVESSLELEVVPEAEDDETRPGAAPYRASMRAKVGNALAESEWDPSHPLLRDLSDDFGAMKRGAGRAVFLRLSARSLAEAHYSEDEEPQMSATGEGLASVIADLWSNDFARRDAIMEGLRRVVPTVRQVRSERAKVVREETELITVGAELLPRRRTVSNWGHRVVVDTTSGDSIPLVCASEGTVLALGLMTVLHGRKRPRTLLMDDLDKALHPKAQQDLVHMLREVMAADPELQILATSHSPFLLDALEHEEVRLTTLAEDGSVLCGALRDHPGFEQWKSLVKPGELWTSGLEDWLRSKRGRAA